MLGIIPTVAGQEAVAGPSKVVRKPQKTRIIDTALLKMFMINYLETYQLGDIDNIMQCNIVTHKQRGPLALLSGHWRCRSGPAGQSAVSFICVPSDKLSASYIFLYAAFILCYQCFAGVLLRRQAVSGLRCYVIYYAFVMFWLKMAFGLSEQRKLGPGTRATCWSRFFVHNNPGQGWEGAQIVKWVPSIDAPSAGFLKNMT